MGFDAHPTVRALRTRLETAPELLTLERVRTIALEAGVDDAGIVSLNHPDLAEERPYAERALPGARSIVSLVVRTHADDIRSPTRSVANLEFHRTGTHEKVLGHLRRHRSRIRKIAVESAERGKA